MRRRGGRRYIINIIQFKSNIIIDDVGFIIYTIINDSVGFMILVNERYLVVVI